MTNLIEELEKAAELAESRREAFLLETAAEVLAAYKAEAEELRRQLRDRELTLAEAEHWRAL